MSPATKNTVIFAVRLVVSLGLLWLISEKVNVKTTVEAISRVDFLLFLLSTLLLSLTTVFNALRWQTIIATMGSTAAYRDLLRILWIGLFFNQVLPSGVGGDAVRLWCCHRIGLSWGTSGKSIILERATGFLTIVLVYAFSLLTLLGAIEAPWLRLIMIGLFSASIAGFAVLLLLDCLPRPLLRLPAVAAIASLSTDARALIQNHRAFFKVLALSMVSLALTIGCFICLNEGLHLDVAWYQWLLITPVLALISLVPISLAGWGVRESAVVAILGQYAVAPEAALALSVLFGGVLVVIGLPGGVLWLLNRERPATQ